MDETEAAVRTAATADATPEQKAREVAAIIRRSGGYRWVGLYAVSESEISVIGWDGPGPPAHPRFPPDRGLCGAAVASGETVVVADVADDPRYLVTLGSTRSEMVVPIVDAGRVLGLVDVESDRLAAFEARDERQVARWGAAAAVIWRAVEAGDGHRP